jgi:putative spermidine/putrescine transport system permease protein
VVALAPFFVYVGLALLLPIGAIVVLALQTRSGHFTWHNMSLLTSGVYRAGFVNSLEVSLEASIIPGVIGLVVAYALASVRHPVVQRVVASASAVLANFGGVNLAFIFIAAYGTTGLTTQWLSDLGFNPWNHGFSLFNFAGIVFIYCYFQIPLMVLVVTPALAGLKSQWREAAEGLGAGAFTYWRRVGLPVLAPAILGAVLLLFGSAFSAYATAEALTSGSVALAPILIGNFLNGNVVAGQEHVGYAISVGMMIILLVTTVFYVLAQRRSQKWLRS